MSLNVSRVTRQRYIKTGNYFRFKHHCGGSSELDSHPVGQGDGAGAGVQPTEDPDRHDDDDDRGAGGDGDPSDSRVLTQSDRR